MCKYSFKIVYCVYWGSLLIRCVMQNQVRASKLNPLMSAYVWILRICALWKAQRMFFMNTFYAITITEDTWNCFYSFMFHFVQL